MVSMGIPAPTSASGGVGYTFANKFSVAGTVTVNFVRWWKDGSSPFPNEIRIRDVTAGTTLVQIGPAPATWVADVDQWYTLDLEANGATPPDLVSGHDYAVVEYGENTGYRQAFGNFVAPDPATGITFIRSYWDPGNLAMPTAANSLPTCYGLDVLTALPVVGPGEGPGTTSGDLFAWLSRDPTVQTHETDGIPWHLEELAAGTNGFAAIKGVVDTIATSVGTGLRAAVTATNAAIDTANTALVHAATTWSDALATALQNMSDDFASFGASKPAQGGGITGTGTFPSNVGTLVWTMLDETDFVGQIAWAQPADVYVLTITERPFRLPLNLTAGVHTIYRCGWWCPLNGSFARQRSYIDFEDNHLAIGAERMPGVLVSLEPGGEGHIQAWALT